VPPIFSPAGSPSEPVDPVVGADAELAEAARALVRVEGLEQELLVSLGGRVYDLAVLEAQLHAGDLPPSVDRGIAERDLAVDRVLGRGP